MRLFCYSIGASAANLVPCVNTAWYDPSIIHSLHPAAQASSVRGLTRAKEVTGYKALPTRSRARPLPLIKGRLTRHSPARALS